MGEVRDSFARMAAHDTDGDAESTFGFSAYRVYFTERYTYSSLGDSVKADAAQAAARALVPASRKRGPAAMDLHQALCMVHVGDVSSGVEHAHTVMTNLPAKHHARRGR